MLLLEYDQIVKDRILPGQPTGAELPHSLDARRPPFIHVNKSLFFRLARYLGGGNLGGRESLAAELICVE
jgi:hypothetical protein